MRGFTSCSIVVGLAAALNASGDTLLWPVRDEKATSTSKPAAKHEETAEQVRHDRASQTEKEAAELIESLCQRLDLDEVQRRSATNVLPPIMRDFAKTWKLKYDDDFGEESRRSTDAVADAPFESALVEMKKQVQIQVEAIASPDQIETCLRLEAAAARRDELFTTYVNAVCGQTPSAQWPPAECDDYFLLLADEPARAWGERLQMNPDQRRMLREVFRELIIGFAFDSRDVCCPLYAAFPCERPDSAMLADPQYCRLYLRFLRRLPDLYEDMESQMAVLLTHRQRRALISLMKDCHRENRSAIARARTVVNRADRDAATATVSNNDSATGPD